jgi:hypothetical protein
VQLFLAANCNWVAADFNAAPYFAFGDGSFDLIILREHRSSASGSKIAAGVLYSNSYVSKLASQNSI